jgi:hypothetical protein
VRRLVALAAVLVALVGAAGASAASTDPLVRGRWSPNDATRIASATQRTADPNTMFLTLEDGRGYKLRKGIDDWPSDARLAKDNPRGTRIVTEADWRAQVNKMLGNKPPATGAPAAITELKAAKPSAWARLKGGILKSGALGKLSLLTMAPGLIEGANSIACALKDTTDYCFNATSNTDPAPAGSGSAISPNGKDLVGYVDSKTVVFLRKGSTGSILDGTSDGGAGAIQCQTTLAADRRTGNPVTVTRQQMLDADLPIASSVGCTDLPTKFQSTKGVVSWAWSGSAMLGSTGGNGWADEATYRAQNPLRLNRGGVITYVMAGPTGSGYQLAYGLPLWDASSLIKDIDPVDRPASGATNRTPTDGYEGRIGDGLSSTGQSDVDDANDADAFNAIMGPDDRPQPDPRITVPGIAIGQSFGDYSDKLHAAGLTGTITRVDLTEASMDPAAGPLGVARVDPAAGSKVDPDTAVSVYVNPATAPAPTPGTEGDPLPGAEGDACSGDSCSPPGTFSLGPLNIPTPCNVFPFGTPCWFLSFLDQWGSEREAPHWTIPGEVLGIAFADSDINVSLDAVTPIATGVRTLLIGLGTLSMAWWFFGLATGKPTTSEAD